MSDPGPLPPDPAPAPPEVARDTEWQRLDPRMLLVHPVRELVKFIPVLLGVFVAGTAAGGGPWQLVAVGVPIGLGLLRYLTTSFRIARGRVELRRGLLDRHQLAVPLDRVRTVDLTASPIHRLLGLATVRIGTGTASTDADEQVDLDALPAERARELRAELLHVSAAPTDAGPAEPSRVVARFTPGWLLYAPFSGGGLAIAAGAVAAVSQVAPQEVRLRVRELPQDWWLLVPLVVVAALVAVGLLSVLAYAAANWNLTLTHAHPGAPWHLRRGLFTTRETSIDEERLAGVTLAEPLLLRMVRGARLRAIVTGLRTGGLEQSAGSTLVPPAPGAVVLRAAVEVVGDPVAVTGVLVDHGPAARRRRFTRALIPVAVLAGAVLAASWASGRWWGLLAVPVLVAGALLLALDRVRALGHGLHDGLLVARAGSLTRRRDVLATEHVIGFNLRSTWFQRRVGVTTLAATTAGGEQAVTVIDVPEPAAVALARRAVPGLVEQFLDGSTPGRAGR